MPGLLRRPLCAFQQDSAATVAELLALGDPWVDDLCQLSWLFYDQYAALLGQYAWTAPENVWSMAGAQADLWLAGCLIDFKTTITPQFDRTWLYQVLGYAMLEHDERHRIGGIGLYMVRQGALIRWSLGKLLPQVMGSALAPLAEVGAAFREMLAREYGLQLMHTMRGYAPRTRPRA